MPQQIEITQFTITKKDGSIIDLSSSILIKDYVRFRKLPSIDSLLDWKMCLIRKLEVEKDENIKNQLEVESKATDFLLDLNNQQP